MTACHAPLAMFPTRLGLTTAWHVRWARTPRSPDSLRAHCVQRAPLATLARLLAVAHVLLANLHSARAVRPAQRALRARMPRPRTAVRAETAAPATRRFQQLPRVPRAALFVNQGHTARRLGTLCALRVTRGSFLRQRVGHIAAPVVQATLPALRAHLRVWHVLQATTPTSPELWSASSAQLAPILLCLAQARSVSRVLRGPTRAPWDERSAHSVLPSVW